VTLGAAWAFITVNVLPKLPMEAMASGLPVVPVNAAALPELVHSGENGHLFEPGKSRDLAERVVVMVGDKSGRNRMAERSLELIQAHDV
jgi:glycosyltransferase involved in cell wall biosynthesis